MIKNESIQREITHCKIMRFSEKESMAYLKKRGYDISPAQFYRLKKRQEETKFARITQIARNMFTEQTLERLDTIDYIHKEMWDNYHQEASPRKRVEILKDILCIQPYISAYYEATRYCEKDMDFPQDMKSKLIQVQKSFDSGLSLEEIKRQKEEKDKEAEEQYRKQKEKAIFSY